MMGPFNTPLGLGRDVLPAAFWVLAAPLLFIYGAAYITAFVLGPDMSATDPAAYQTFWLISCLCLGVWFALVSFWSELQSAGPFAGNMGVEPGWLLGAVLLGPVILLLPGYIVALFQAGENWQYREEVDPTVFDPANWTLAFIFMAVILAPLVEEVTFRGIALGALIARGASPALAVVLSSAAFAMIHLQYTPAALIVVFVAGLGFGVLRLLSGSMIVPILAHTAANGLTLWLTWLAATLPA